MGPGVLTTLISAATAALPATSTLEAACRRPGDEFRACAHDVLPDCACRLRSLRLVQRAGGSIPLLRTRASFSRAPMNLTIAVATSFSFETASTPAANGLYCCSSGGSTPPNSAPATGRMTLICCSAISTSPRATASAAGKPSRNLVRAFELLGEAEIGHDLRHHQAAAGGRVADRLGVAHGALEGLDRAQVELGGARLDGDPDAGAGEIDPRAHDLAALDEVVDHARVQRHDVGRRAGIDLGERIGVEHRIDLVSGLRSGIRPRDRAPRR